MTDDKRRIDACLKACEGISTQNLEDNVPFLELARLYNVVLRERDALRINLDDHRALVFDLRKEVEKLRAKIEQMEKQEPVGEIVAFGESLHEVSWKRGKLPHLGAKLYAIPGAQPAPSIHEVTDAMALAFHAALTDGSIGEHEMEEIKAGLRAALAAAPEAKP